MTPSKKLAVIDGNALVHRAWHALPPLQTKRGQLVNAVYGFLLVFFKVLKDLKPTHCVVAFDHKGPTFRHKEYAEYKATRVKQPDELYAQIPILKQVLQAMRVTVVEVAGVEADDTIGTITKMASKDKINTFIVTGDLDTLQLIDDFVSVYTLRKGLTDSVEYDRATVQARYGLSPESLVEYRALRGDPSDNIPGVRGIGEKTAIALIKKFGTVNNLYQTLEKSEKISAPLTPRLRDLLLQHKKEAMLSRKLSEIVRQVPIDIIFDDYRMKPPDIEKIVPLFQELEFKSLLSKLPTVDYSESTALSDSANKNQTSEHYKCIQNNADFEQFIKQLKKEKTFVFDTETTGLNPFEVDLLGISFCWSEAKAFYVPIDGHKSRLETLRPIFENNAIKKWGHNIKYDIEVLAHSGVDVAGVEGDTMIASYILNPGSRAHDLDTLAFTEFGHRMIPITHLIGEKPKQKSMREVPLHDLAIYSCEDADYTWRLKDKLMPEISEAGLSMLFHDIEMPLIEVLKTMETNGIKINPKTLARASATAKKRLAVLEKKIYHLAGTEFNIASPQQLKEVLFEKLQLSTEGIGKTKTGFSTAAMELEKLKNLHPIIEPVIEHRELSKLVSTYLEALPKLFDKKTQRIHTSFNQTITATGRLSSSEPNLQNIPIRTSAGVEVRRAFVAEHGYSLLSADYSQIELRIVASLANDKAMINIFRRGDDVHRATAAAINNVSLDKVTPEMRYAAKEVNFGVIYGMGAWGLAARTGIDRASAQDFITKYFETFSGVKQFLNEIKDLARARGFVETLFGRRRYIPEINSGVPQVRASAERMAVNMPIQGTAADLIKLAMIKVHRDLNKINAEARLVLQVHDELVLEVPTSHVASVGDFVQKTMESVGKLKVPIEVHLKAGKNWGEMK